MFYTSGDDDSVWILAYKLDCITYVVAPKAGIVVDDEYIIDSCLYICKAVARSIVRAKLRHRNEFEENTGIGIQK